MPSILDRLRGVSGRRKVGRFCALDFDGRHLRVVQAEVAGERARILRLVTADMPAGLDIADAQAVGDFLGRTLAQMRLRNAAVLMNVPRGQAVLKPLVLPPVTGFAELANMVQYQAEKELTFRPEEAVIDFTIESHYGLEPGPQDEPQGEHVLVAAVQRPIVDYYRKVAEVAGVRLLRLGLRPYANVRCVEAYGGLQGRGRVALVHVTAQETEIDVMEDGGLTFSRSAVIEVPTAKEGGPEAADGAVQAVAQEVTRSLQSYMAVERGQRIERVLLAGGTGLEPPVASELARRLGVRCEILNLTEALGLEDQRPAESAFVSALGLAVGQAADTAPPFDFLNPKRAPVRRDLTRAIAITCAAAVVVALVAAFSGAAIHLYRANSQVEELTRELNDLNTENRKVAVLAKRVQTIEDWVRSGRDWLDQWAYLTGVFPSCADTYVTSLKTNPGAEASVSFTVKAKNNEAIDDLGKRLAAAGYEFRPGQVTTGSDRYGYDSSTSVKILVKPDMQVALADLAPVPRPDDDVSAEKFGAPSPVAERQPAAPAPQAPAPAAPQPAPEASAEGQPQTMEAWRQQFEALMRQRPPPDQEEATNAWRQKREDLRKIYEILQQRQREQGNPTETRYPNGRESRPPEGQSQGQRDGRRRQ